MFEYDIAQAINKNDINQYVYVHIKDTNISVEKKFKLLNSSAKDLKIIMYKHALHNEYVDIKRRKKCIKWLRKHKLI